MLPVYIGCWCSPSRRYCHTAFIIPRCRHQRLPRDISDSRHCHYAIVVTLKKWLALISMLAVMVAPFYEYAGADIGTLAHLRYEHIEYIA